MASVALTVTVTDTVNHPLAQVRDKLLIKWNAPLNLTNPQKIDFIETHLAQYIKRQYIEQLQLEAQALNEQADVDVQ